MEGTAVFLDETDLDGGWLAAQDHGRRYCQPVM